jgi:putative transposase
MSVPPSVSSGQRRRILAPTPRERQPRGPIIASSSRRLRSSPFQVMVSFIDDHREAHRLGPQRGPRPICKVLPIAPSTYHEHADRRADPAKLSARAKRDVALGAEIRRVFTENFEVYCACKVWRQLRREGFEVARCIVERLMRCVGLRWVIRGKPVRMTVRDKAA